MDNKDKKIKKPRGLGKGINALFESPVADNSKTDVFAADDVFSVKAGFEEEAYDASKVVKIKLRDIEPNPKQPRRNFEKEKLEALADSLKTHGIIQPILVKKNDNGMYTIIAGERRWRASKIAGIDELPCIIKDFDEKELMEIALIENLQREDLNPIEEAEGYKNLMEKFNMTQEEVSERVGKSRSAVANSLRLNKLCDEIKEMLIDGKISQGHARTILPVDDKKAQIEIAEKIVKDGLNVRQTEKLVKDFENKIVTAKVVPSQPAISKDMIKYYASLEETLSKKFSTKVKFNIGKNKSKIEIEYYSSEDLERLLYELKK